MITMDFYPTLLEAAGVPLAPGQHVDGVSLLPLLRGTGTLPRRSLYWHYPHYHPGGVTPYSAVRNGDYRLMEFFEDQRVELYDLRKDPEEKQDLAAAMPEKARELREELAEWRKQVGAQLPTPNPDYVPPQ